MPRVSGTGAMIAAMAPRRVPGLFVFATLPGGGADPSRLTVAAIATMREDEGISLILPLAVARAEGFRTDLPLAQITLEVHSALDGVGLTSAVASALAKAGIACNVVAGHHHDHLFVPEQDADAALACLNALATGTASSKSETKRERKAMAEPEKAIAPRIATAARP